MLNLVLGRAGTGKTEYVRNLLGDRAKEGDTKLLLIVPEQFSYSSERALLESFGPKTANNIEVLSFSRLVDYVNRALGGLSGNAADDGAKVIIMLHAIEGISDNLEWYKSHVNSVPFAKEIIKLIAEFKKEKVTPEILTMAAGKTSIKTLKTKLLELAMIYSAYEAAFSQYYVDNDTLINDLCALLEENKFFENYTICIDAFKGFTGQELEIIKHLIKQAEDVYLTLCTNDPYSDDPSMIFGSINDTAKLLERIAKEEGVKVKAITGFSSLTRFDKNETLKYVEKNIFSPTAEIFTEENDSVSLVVANDIHDECKFIAAEVRKLIREGNYRLRDIAIIPRQESDYKRELVGAFTKYGIPVFEDKRQPLVNQPLISLTKSALLIMAKGFSTENILRYLKSGLSPVSDYDILKLENYALMWGLHADEWKNGFTNSPKGLDGKDDAGLEKLNEIRKTFIDPLEKLKNSKHSNAIETSEALYNFLIETEVPKKLKSYAIDLNKKGFESLAVEQDTVWEELMDIINMLGTVYGEEPINIATYVNLFDTVVNMATFGTLPHGLDEITIGSADRTRLSNPKVVFVVGCEEGIFPANVSYPGILSLRERDELSRLDVKLALPSKLKACEERFIAYSALTSATEKLYVTHHRKSGANDSNQPSVIVNSIKELFGEEIEIDASTLSPLFYAETATSTFSAYAEDYQKLKGMSDEMIEDMNSIRSVLTNDDNYKGRIERLDNASEKRKYKIKDEKIAKELFGETMYLSASRVDNFYSCPFQYFCKYGLLAYPNKKATLDPMHRGTIIHDVLEKVIREYKREGLLALDENGRRSAVKKYLDAYADEKIDGLSNKNHRFTYLYNRLLFIILNVLERIIRELETSQFNPSDFELKIGDNEPISAYEVKDKSGKVVLKIKGSVDRVDTYEKEGETYIRVVDYKTGGKEFVLSDILFGLNMQMLIYLFAIEADTGNHYNGEVKPASVFYYPAKTASITIEDRDAEKENIEKAMYLKGRGNGLFIKKFDILHAMDENLCGDNIPISYNPEKDTFKGDTLVEIDDLILIKDYVDELLREMVEKLHNGEINVDPYEKKKKNKKDACKYCDYKSICGFEDEEKKEIKESAPAAVIAKLKGGDDENVSEQN